jgi:hypothetical protein
MIVFDYLIRLVPLSTIQLISIDVFRRKIERKQFLKNFIMMLKLKSMFYLENRNIKFDYFCFRFSKKRYSEIKETNRRRVASLKHMKRLKNKKK